MVLGFIAVRSRGPFTREIIGDGAFYIHIGESLASGKGYILPGSPWPGKPELGRLPLWPAVLSVPSWLFPKAVDFVVLRWTGIVVNAFAAMLLVLLTYRLRPDPWIALLAGCFMVIYPSELASVDMGVSEPIFFVAVTGGLLLLFRKGFLQMIGAIVLGCAVLARSNFVILPILFAMMVFLSGSSLRRYTKRMLLLTAAFYLPTACWVARNATVSGVFMINAMEGETLYGANNPVVASELDSWGYWILPDMIPGETSKLQLGKEMTEAEANEYYHRKAVLYFRTHLSSYPRLILGKLIRGFVPMPWSPVLATDVADAFRLLLYVVFLATIRRWREVSDPYLFVLAAIFAVDLITTVIFYGSTRFTLCVEIYLIPCAAIGIVNAWRSRRVPVLSPAHESPHPVEV